jgi:YHS domain-containing protein
MVQDPQCRTYIVKERAVLRRIGGAPRYFCCEACADAYAKSHRA